MIEECLAVEVRVSGDDCPLAEATAATRTPARAEPPQLRADGNVLLRFGAPRDDGFAACLDADDRIRYLHRSRAGERDTYRCLSKHPCVVHELVSAGLLVEDVTYRDGDATVTGAVVGHEVLRGVMETAGGTVGVQLTRTYPLREETDPVSGRFGLTPPQTEALRAAVEAGYFAVPRAASSADVAAELGLSKSAFLERLRRAEATLYRELFADR
ncbi:helix-turn-helix domain-containing protein [Halobaculum gomorrense]|uniref:Predicted DNA binding protein, contains HTH domain n=1 Tax=Halobaculum gomorrense TaxID=43928 RepID=A0A1M5K207_9EURY|nr:helix-turn-helix domain-containing protein [Halobaculum gomorrense]SHG46353.1 Predicted DNA binding protein, contains HTH domain [Halobaculum gomorrense]